MTTRYRNYHPQQITYHTFNIAWWRREVGATEKELQMFLLPVLQFIERELSSGHSILIHCLAGAHRAGTTAIISLMHFVGLDSQKAIVTAKSLRSCIEPIGDFRQLLARCDGLPRNSAGGFVFSEG